MSETPWWLEQPSDLLEHEPAPSCPDEIAAWAATADFGSGVLTPFGTLDPVELCDAGRVDALIALERLRAWADAQQARLYAAMSVPAGEVTTRFGTREPDKQWVRDEIACALRLSPATTTAAWPIGGSARPPTPLGNRRPNNPRQPRKPLPRHHHLKHDAGWTVTGNPNHTLTWTSPTGHTYPAPLDVYE
ncbi:MAG: hypothetical protein ABI345_09200 [Jatrophihabitans sp.]